MLEIIWQELCWPLLRIIFLVSIGLFVANFIEALNWTNRLAVIARPLIRTGNLSAITGASFSMAFFSGVSANSMLAEAYDQESINRKELVLANLFNGLPRFFLHLPTVFFLTAPLIKGAAFFYVGLTFAAALIQTMVVVLLGRLILPKKLTKQEKIPFTVHSKLSWRVAIEKSKKRFLQRIPRLLKFTVPVYVVFFLLNRYGIFNRTENFLVNNAWFLSWLDPKSLGIVVLHVTAEFSAGLAAAGALLAENSLNYHQVVLALLAGNILAAPIRAVRHQFPYYVGIFNPKLALALVGYSQLCRLISLIAVGFCYYLFIPAGP